MNHPKPSRQYQEWQRQLRVLSEGGTGQERRTTLEKKLLKEFMAAWGFKPDRLRLGYKLGYRLKPNNGGLDHCSYLTGPNDERVIVTQPYGDFAEQLKQDFTLDDGVGPEAIEASEWAYYFPGHAKLVILIFPSDYAKSLDAHVSRKRQVELAALRAS